MFTFAVEVEEVVFIAVGGGVLAVWIVMATLHNIVKRGSFEKSRREIAAYVAEGSMTPEDGERLLRADPLATTPKKS